MLVATTDAILPQPEQPFKDRSCPCDSVVHTLAPLISEAADAYRYGGHKPCQLGVPVLKR